MFNIMCNICYVYNKKLLIVHSEEIWEQILQCYGEVLMIESWI